MQPDIDLAALRDDPTVVDLVHRIALFQRMPLTFNALVVEKVARCNARCAMCYQSAGPRGSEEIGDVAIAVEDLLPVIDGAAKIPTPGPWNSETRRAFVCDSDLSFGMARMAQALNDERPSEIRVFREISEALDWLELDRPD